MICDISKLIFQLKLMKAIENFKVIKLSNFTVDPYSTRDNNGARDMASKTKDIKLEPLKTLLYSWN